MNGTVSLSKDNGSVDSSNNATNGSDECCQLEIDDAYEELVDGNISGVDDDNVNSDDAMNSGEGNVSGVDADNDNVDRQHLRIWGAEEAHDPISNDDDINDEDGDYVVDKADVDVDRHHLKIWGADEADDPNDGVNKDVDRVIVASDGDDSNGDNSCNDTNSNGNCYDDANSDNDGRNKLLTSWGRTYLTI